MSMTVQDVIDQMSDAGLPGLLPHDVLVDGKIHRFRHDNTGSKTGWYVLHASNTSHGEFITGRFGCWKLNINQKVSCKGYRKLSEAERAEMKRRWAEAKRAQEAQQKARAQRAAKWAAKVWSRLKGVDQHPYLARKRAQAGKARLLPGRNGLVLPMQDFKGFIHGLQIIYPNGGKQFWPKGMAKKKRFALIGSLSRESSVAVVCEGYATGWSIHEATGLPVLVAFDAGNLVEVCQQARYHLPGMRFIVAADDDYLTTEPMENPGLTMGARATKRCNGVMAVPVFANRPEGAKWTDFNDLHLEEGLGSVKAIFDQALAAEPEAPPIPDADPAAGDDAGGADEPHWTARMSRTDTGNLRGDILNTKLVLENDSRWRGVVGFCDFSSRVMKRRAPPFPGGDVGEWGDSDTDNLRIWLQEKYGFTPKNADADGALMVVARLNRFHPVQEYLATLEWDGKVRLEGWLSTYLGAKFNEYTMAVGRKWLIAAVARVMEYPVKSDCLLILEGSQGLGKSTAFSILGGDWFSDTHFALGEKDGYQQMQGVWICELAELDSFNKAETNRAKSFFSAEVDRYRPPYGRRPVDMPRQCVFAGTTNHDSYLKDPTGNRRYWPVAVIRLDAEALLRDRDQLWAEALHRYREGVPWHVLPEEREMFGQEQDSRFESDVWESVIYKWLREITRDKVTMAEVMEEALKMDPAHMRKPEQTRVGQVLHRLGWHKQRLMVAGNRDYYYVAPEGWMLATTASEFDDVSGF